MIIKRILLSIALHIIKFNNFNILLVQDKGSSVIFCFCCEEHLREGCVEITNSLNLNHLTLNPKTGQNNERSFV